MSRYTVVILVLLMFTVYVPCNGQVDCSSSVSGCNITFNCESTNPQLQSFKCTIDGDPVNCTFPFTLDRSQFSTERQHVLIVNASFPNGVVTNSFGFSGCERDGVNLILGCQSVLDNTVITVQCNPNFEVESYLCSFDLSPPQTCTLPQTIDVFEYSEGDHTLVLSAIPEQFPSARPQYTLRFSGSRESTTPQPSTPTIDEFQIECLPVVTAEFVIINCTANKEVVAVLCSIDSGPPQQCAFPLQLRRDQLTISTHTVSFSLITSDGGTFTTEVQFDLRQVQLDIRCSGRQEGDLYIIDCDSNNRLVSVDCSLDGGEEYPCALPYSLNISTLTVGNHSIVIRVQDEFGVISLVPLTLTKSEIQIRPLDCSAIPMGNSITIECAADEDIVEFRCRIDDGEFFPCSLPYSISSEGLDTGTHVLVLEATRISGATSRATLNFTISERPPIGLQCQATQASETSSINVSCTVQKEDVSLSCSLDFGPLPSELNCGLDLALKPNEFEPGEHVFSLTATDNFTTDVYTLNFTSFKLRVFCRAVARPGQTEILCTSSNNLTSFMCSFDGGPVMPCDLSFIVTPPEFAVGGHNVTFMATDIFDQMLTLFLEFPIIPELEVVLSFVSPVSTVSEDAGTVEVCLNKNLRTNAFSLPLNVRELEPTTEAEAGVDFDSSTVFVQFPAEAGNACVNVSIFDDVKALEGDERFVVEFDEAVFPSNANVGSLSGTTITIQDDDQVVIGLTKDTFQFTESEDAVVQVSVVGDVAQELTIFLQQGAPYTSIITTTLGPGDINQITNITLVIPGNDIALQPTVTFPVSLSVPDAVQSGVQVGGQIDSMTLFGSSSVEISDGDTVAISFSDTVFTASESSGSVTICLEKDRETAEEIAVTVTAASQGSLGSESVELVFPAGSGNTVCTNWTIIDDSLSEGDQDIAISFSIPPIPGVVTGTPDMSTIIITDDEAVTINFSDAVFTASESSGFVTICLVKNRAITAPITITVTAASQGSLGSESVDVVFPANSDDTVCTDWTIVDDALSQGDQTITIDLSIPPIPGVMAGDLSVSSIVITDDEPSGPFALNCTIMVSPSAVLAVLNCMDYPPGVTDGVCFVPGVNSITPFDCPIFPFEFDISYIPTGERIIEIKGRRVDTGMEISLANVSLIIPDLDLYFYGNTPRLAVDSVYAQFESNRGGLEYECHLTHFSGDGRTDCSNGTFFVPGIPPGDYTLRVVATNPPRGERKVIRNRLWIHGDDVYCITSLINRGWRVEGNSFTVEFTSTGIASSFQCVLDRLHVENCTSPLVLTDLSPGRHHVRVIPQGCGRSYRVWNTWFTIN